MKAIKIWDNRIPEDLRIPEDMGVPADGQLVGTGYERLCELAGRVCYDSLGQGRSSEDYHNHILEVGHLSVYEHAVFCVKIEESELPLSALSVMLLKDLVNRPCIHLSMVQGDYHLRLNLRHVLEWGKTSPLYLHIQKVGHEIAPMVVPSVSQPCSDLATVTCVRPISQFQIWKSMYIQTSRNASMEHIRHGDDTSISQRSTRYVDENSSPFEVHPELVVLNERQLDRIAQQHASSQEVYSETLAALEAAGVSRKQARGAARGVLGGALRTEYIFGASDTQWGHMMGMRAHPAADAEIRKLFDKHIGGEL